MQKLSAEDIARAKELGDLSPDCYTPSEQQVALPSMFLGLALALIGLVLSLISIMTLFSVTMLIVAIISGLGVIVFILWIWCATMKNACIKRVQKAAKPPK